MQWMLIVALLLLVIATAYVLQMSGRDYGFPDKTEGFTGRGNRALSNLTLIPQGSVEQAEIDQGLLLADVLQVQTGVTALGAGDCAAADSTRQMELGGQYVQRTNNYVRDYPDHCSSLQSQFVGGFYKPKTGGVGLTVPCNGQC
jgi:hypothetical protein